MKLPSDVIACIRESKIATNINEDLLQCCEAFICDSSDPRHNVSNSAEATHVGLDRNTLRKYKQDTAATALTYECAMFDKLQAVLENQHDEQIGSECYLYYELATYDGVDFCITNRTMCDFLDKEDGANGVFAQLDGGARRHTQEEERTQTHILQFSGNDVCVIKDGTKYIIFCAHMLSRLTCFDRNFATVMAKVVSSHSRASVGNADHYTRKIRVCGVDRAGYNTACEAILSHHRAGRNWALIAFYCLVHIIYNVFKGVYQLPQLKMKITGMVNYALSFRPAGSLTTLRKAFFETALHHADIVNNLYIGRDAQEYKEWILRLFYGGDLELQDI